MGIEKTVITTLAYAGKNWLRPFAVTSFMSTGSLAHFLLRNRKNAIARLVGRREYCWMGRMINMTYQEINKRFAELAGICWHEQKDSQTLECKHCGEGLLFPWQRNPDFCADPRLVLEVMMKREDWPGFCFNCNETMGVISGEPFVKVAYVMDTTGKLALAAIEWMKGRE